MNTLKTYPADVSDEEWALISCYLAVLSDTFCQRRHPSREVFNGLRHIVRSGGQWRMLPHDFPPWAAVYQQTRRWLEADVCDTMTGDLRELLRWVYAKDRDPTACMVSGP